MMLTDNWYWEAPKDWLRITSIDLHTGGEPLRVFTGGLPEIKGKTILEKRRYFRDNYDYIRTGTMWEPRGHADMYGAIITEPTSDDGDFGTFFLHNEGYSTMCGHAMIALVTLVLDTEMIVRQDENPIIKIDAPPGRITCQAFRRNGKVEKVSFQNVPSFISMKNQIVDVPEIGKVQFDLGYGGAFYAYVQADELGLQLDESDYNNLIEYGKKIKYAVMDQFEIKHPLEDDLSFLYGTIFIGKAQNTDHHTRNVCIFAEGEVDRSATGPGVSGRAAILHAKGELNENHEIIIESILGTTMSVKVIETCKYERIDAIIPEVSGTASITGKNEFYFDPNDPLKNGFIFR